LKPDLCVRLLVLAALALSLAGACGSPTLNGSESCQQLLQDYENAYPAALACDPGAANQCQQWPMSNSACNCARPVQDPTQLNAIAMRLHAQGCIPSRGYQCPCPVPVPLTCVATDAAGGTCAYQPPAGG
jgi:hypothetical protein